MTMGPLQVCLQVKALPVCWSLAIHQMAAFLTGDGGFLAQRGFLKAAVGVLDSCADGFH